MKLSEKIVLEKNSLLILNNKNTSHFPHDNSVASLNFGLMKELMLYNPSKLKKAKRKMRWKVSKEE